MVNAQQLVNDALVWDNHLCMPLRPDDESFLPQLAHIRQAGCTLVSLNIGFDLIPWEDALKNVATMRRWLKLHPEEYLLVETANDVLRAQSEGKLGVVFDLEGGVALDKHLPMIQLYYDLGVRWMLLAYNANNELGGGCEDNCRGLTDAGRSVVAEMERVGMVVCCSHTSFRTSMDIMEVATNPVIFSHSNPSGVWAHYRNIPDEAIMACAGTGGVVGINGIGNFLGVEENLVDAVVRHIDYVAQMVGTDHVGIATDYIFDKQEIIDFMIENPDAFDGDKYPSLAMIGSETISDIAERLLLINYKEECVRKIIGGNHFRIASQVWK